MALRMAEYSLQNTTKNQITQRKYAWVILLRMRCLIRDEGKPACFGTVKFNDLIDIY